MRPPALVPAFIAAVATAAAPAAPAAASPQLGIAKLEPDSTACVTLHGPLVRSGERIYVVLFEPPRVVDGVIVARRPEPCLDASGDDLCYVARMRFTFGAEPVLGVAVFDRTARVRYEEGEIVIHTKDVASPLQFRHCYSSEGEHFTTWRGTRRTWHTYHYLGIDLEGNCTDEEVGERP